MEKKKILNPNKHPKVIAALKTLERHEKRCKKDTCKAMFTCANHCKIGQKLYNMWWDLYSKYRVKQNGK